MKHVFYGFSENGNKREANQDSILIRSNGEYGLFCVADGMGGHSRGEVASQTIVETLSNWWEDFLPEKYNNDFGRMMYSLSQMLALANNEIIASCAPNEICGSTVTILFVWGDNYGILYAGDSRIYTIKKRKLVQISVDETWENNPDNKLSEREKRKHPNWGKLCNALGVSDQVKITSRTDVIRKGFLFILCSDGVYKYCPYTRLSKIIRWLPIRGLNKSSQLIKKQVYYNGANDNLSLIIVGDAERYKI